ncbi:MAG: cytochrome ubiquinol oxidase subunit I [Asticcacaulis sp.]|uniref:cytochrome ubiquinol oxidase subunit I n=1 Tax=Asticcacaulis sp. TaxID=1872648 RepID=UPI0039E21BA6
MDLSTVELSRLQFALTAMYHFLFVPLTLGMSFMLVIMESVYVLTRKEIWRTITRFWGLLFGINFVLGVATGLTMEFEFGMNWSYYSHYVGDIFGAPLAIEGLMAFFLEATFVGLMFFGWEKLSRPAHLMVTFLVALGTNLSALWILIANGWMQHPTGAEFNPATMRMEVTNFIEVLFNPVAQAKFVHTVSAGYVLAAVFVMGVSAIYLWNDKWTSIAKRSMAVAAAFGLASSLSVVVLGDESGYALTDNQKMKLAALESMWHTEKAPAGISIFGIPNVKEQRTDFDIKIPYVLGLIATRSVDTPVIGILDLTDKAEVRIRSGIIAYDGVEKLKVNADDMAARGEFEAHKADLGYALLLKKYVSDPRTASNQQIVQASLDTIPNVPVMFWAFRLMAYLGFAFILLFATAFLMVTFEKHNNRLFLLACMIAIPFPWIAIEAGWLLAEIGRQPWAVDGVLPTFMGASSLTKGQIWATIFGFTAVYATMAVIEVKLMIRAINKGPYENKLGRMHDDPEVSHTDDPAMPVVGPAE